MQGDCWGAYFCGQSRSELGSTVCCCADGAVVWRCVDGMSLLLGWDFMCRAGMGLHRSLGVEKEKEEEEVVVTVGLGWFSWEVYERVFLEG